MENSNISQVFCLKRLFHRTMDPKRVIFSTFMDELDINFFLCYSSTMTFPENSLQSSRTLANFKIQKILPIN